MEVDAGSGLNRGWRQTHLQWNPILAHSEGLMKRNRVSKIKVNERVKLEGLGSSGLGVG